MTWLYILLGVIAFLGTLLMHPLVVELFYDDTLHLKVRFLFYTYQIAPPKKKKKKSADGKEKPEDAKASSEQTDPKKTSEEEEKPAKKKNALKDYVDKNGLDGLMELVGLIVRIVGETRGRLSKYLVIRKLVIRAVVVGEDSAKTALMYGYACSGIYPAVSFLQEHTQLIYREVDLSAGFLAEKTAVELTLQARISLMMVLGILISEAVKFLIAIAKK